MKMPVKNHFSWQQLSQEEAKVQPACGEIVCSVDQVLSAAWQKCFFMLMVFEYQDCGRSVVSSVVYHQYICVQGGRTWQPFVGGKNGHENFRQARIYNFCDKCVIFACNRKFANLTHWNMQYIPCNSALLAQETLILTQKGTFFAQSSPKSA